MNKSLLLLTISLLVSPLAQADNVPGLTADTADLILSVNQDVKYLHQAVDDCTRHGDRVRKEMVIPIYNDLKVFRAGIDSTYGKFTAPKAGVECQRPSKQQLDQAIAVANKVISVIQEKNVQSSTPQARLFGKSGDEVMKMALSDDGSYPKCKAQNARDPYSTRQLKSYFLIKQNLLKLQAVMRSLKSDMTELKNGNGEAVCLERG